MNFDFVFAGLADIHVLILGFLGNLLAALSYGVWILVYLINLLEDDITNWFIANPLAPNGPMPLEAYPTAGWWFLPISVVE